MKTQPLPDEDYKQLTNGSGVGQVIYGDKCDSYWYDKDCPNPATCAEYHYGQFGHKVMFYFCEECYAKPRPTLKFFGHENEERYFEKYRWPIQVVLASVK